MNRAPDYSRSALILALPSAARSMCLCGHIDPAEAWIAHAQGQSESKARSKARNDQRDGGASWPDRLPENARIDHSELLEIQHSWGLCGTDPAEFLADLEAALAAAGAENAPQRALRASWAGASTSDMADVFGLTQRQAQNIKRKKVTEADQLDLFGEPLDLAEGGEK